MTTSVKIFCGSSRHKTEDKINRWLEENDSVEIIFVQQSQNNENEIVITVFYEWQQWVSDVYRRENEKNGGPSESLGVGKI